MTATTTATRLPTRPQMIRAFLDGDPGAEGIFVVAVRTTGIVCRPTCPARKPKPENVEFFATTADALLAGYRPCKRCRPLDLAGRPPELVERLRAEIEADPSARPPTRSCSPRGSTRPPPVVNSGGTSA